VSFCAVEKAGAQRIVASLGILVSLLLVTMKSLPIFPGHFTRVEWLALAIWLGLGLLLHRRRRAG
jgi:hypothetical protein